MITGNIKPELEIQLRDYCKSEKCTISKATNNAIEEFLNTKSSKKEESNELKSSDNDQSEQKQTTLMENTDTESSNLTDIINNIKKGV